jgi:hypothetical protein
MRQVEQYRATLEDTSTHDGIHHRRQGHHAACEMACIQKRTMPSDEDAIEYQLRDSSSNRSVQLMPASVDVQMEPPLTTAARLCAL